MGATTLETPAETPMADTIFGRIIAGQIPCHKVYEDERVLAFLDINPLTRGHTLVIPKEPAETLDTLSDESAAALGRVLPRICRAVIAAAPFRPLVVSKAWRTSANRLPLSFEAEPSTARPTATPRPETATPPWRPPLRRSASQRPGKRRSIPFAR